MIKKAFLDKISFFRGFSDAEREEIAGLEGAKFQKFSDNEPIVNEGEIGDTFYILLQGSAAVYKKPFMDPIAWLQPGQVFGEVAFLSPRARTTSIAAMEETFVLVFPKTILKVLSPDVRDKLKDQLIVILIRHFDSLREVIENTKIAPALDQTNPFEELEDDANEENLGAVFFEDAEGLKITYLGKRRCRIEKDGKINEVDLVSLQEKLPGKYEKAIKGAGKDPEDYLYGDQFVVPREAMSAWNRVLVAADNKLLQKKRKIEDYQKIEGLYSG